MKFKINEEVEVKFEANRSFAPGFVTSHYDGYFYSPTNYDIHVKLEWQKDNIFSTKIRFNELGKWSYIILGSEIGGLNGKNGQIEIIE